MATRLLHILSAAKVEGWQNVLARAQRRTRPQPGATLHFQDVALNFQVLVSHPGITFSDFCASQGPRSSYFAMGIAPVCSQPRLLKQMLEHVYLT